MKEFISYVKYHYYRYRGAELMKMYQNTVGREFSGDYKAAEKFYPFLTKWKEEAKQYVAKARAAQFIVRNSGIHDY